MIAVSNSDGKSANQLFKKVEQQAAPAALESPPSSPRSRYQFLSPSLGERAATETAHSDEVSEEELDVKVTEDTAPDLDAFNR